MIYTIETKNKVIEIFDSKKFKTSKEIGNYLNVPDYYVRRILNEKNKYFGHFTPFRSADIINPDVYFESFIIGSMLGDGHMTSFLFNENNTSKNKNSKLSIKHSIVQKEYVLYKKEIIEQLGCKTIVSHNYRNKDILINERIIKNNGTITLDTIQNVYFNKYRDIWYNKGFKEVPDGVKLDSLSLAIWYMDDGHKCQHGGYYLSTDGFNDISLERLQKMLLDINIESKCHKANPGQYKIYIPKRSLSEFNKIVEPYIHNSMKYKLLLA